MNNLNNFIVIDDDNLNNVLCRFIIERATPVSEYKAFEIPQEGLRFMSEKYSHLGSPAIVFLDINMPGWSGWDFLDNYERLDGAIKDQFRIYMLSSSIDPEDMERAKKNKNVLGYISKPLSENAVLEILEQVG